ncbi:putative MFS family arabinose efflux permease [Pseudorhizobium tarimense]|uniref:MFS family arabinose efflux permease n=1 Tax=Pseudorhizobium tarimense TaxID=1079109 RepID=A0ABV2H6N7_9HYPH|nr:YbfB/YjiJ family MFS transporter [Pseudorhizobium tarimense]MCJ8519446.1 MFS transporter [Pseudorhizobium tarimense]
MTLRSVPPASSPILVGLGGALAMAAAMGFGRFVFTPILPGMMEGASLSAADAGLIAGANFLGYLAGAILSSFGWAAGRERRVALLGLLATAVLLAAMAVTDTLSAFLVIRFLAGLASAFAMVFTSSIVLPHGAESEAVPLLHFGGVGFGIALSSALVFVINLFAGDGAHGWRLSWIGSAVLAAVVVAVVAQLLPRPMPGSAPVREPALSWRRPLVLLTLSYGLFGFGYVITATFLVAIARSTSAGPVVEFLAWFVTGTAAALSLIAWRRLVRRAGLAATYLACIVLEAIGVLASVLLPPVAGALIGGLFLGLTFIAVTAYGLQLGRILSPESPRRALAIMTAAFGTGQIIGPLVAGWLAEGSGSFTLPTIVAAAMLAASALLVLPLLRKSA